MRGVDQGALTATTFTTVFVLVMDDGEYDLLNGVVGLVCALILLAYYRPLPAETPFDARSAPGRSARSPGSKWPAVSRG
jgi:hypothetical protein